MSKALRMRLGLIFFLIIVMYGLVVLKLFKLQVVDAAELSERALYQRLRIDTITPERGDILDRNGKILAESIPTPAVYADPSVIKDPKTTAEKLAPVLEMSEERLYELLTRPGSFVWLTRDLPIGKRSKIESLNLRGIRIVSLPRRYYPEGTLAASTIGIAGIDNQGLEGIEVTYERYLAGEPGVSTVEKDPAGREIPVGFTSKSLPQNGVTLYLTIDAVIQHIAEREIEKAVISSNAKKGILLAMDPKTGEILALAEYPSFVPNNFAEYPLSIRKNWSITESFEPGSTFKVFVAAAAIEEGVINPSTEVFDPPTYTVGDRVIRCASIWGHGHETFLEALERSCNPVFAKLAAEDMDHEVLYKYLRAFGFGQKTGIDFIGEASGILAPVENLSKVSWANIGFGQGIAVTPLQLVTAMSAIANDGYLVTPSLVKSYKENGKIISRDKSNSGRQVISESTANTIKMMLRSVVVNGSGQRAEIAGFPVGGKTGTAQIPVAGGYSEDDMVVSFLGFAPIDDPQIVALVAIFEPQTDSNYGGVLAAPVFKEFTSAALQYTGVRTRVHEGGSIAVPNLTGMTRDMAVKELTKLGLRVNAKGEGAKVSSQEPLPGFFVEPNTTVTLFCALQEQRETPRFIGLSLAEAQSVALSRGINIKINGSKTDGIVASQKPAAGQMLGSDEYVELTIISQ